MEKKQFPVSGMMCATCAISIENILKKTSGVKSVSVNYANQKVNIEFDEKIISKEDLKKIVKQAGYNLEINYLTREELESKRKVGFKKQKLNFIGSLFCSVPVFIISMFHLNFTYSDYIQLILATICIIFFGNKFFVGAYNSLKNKSANMDTLVAMSVSAAYIYSFLMVFFGEYFKSFGVENHLYFEASVVIISLILLGKLLEDFAKNKTSDAISKLIDLKPQTAFVKKNNSWQEIPTENILKDDIVLVKAGQKIAVDGEVIFGESFVDESMITGESLPVAKNKGEKVFSGTINQTGSFEMKAEKVGKDTLLASIIRAVEDASGSKAPVQKLVDKISSVFVPVVIFIAILSFILWIFFDYKNGFAYGFQAFVTVLVIACPCALGLATPTAIMVGIGKSAQKGILIKNAEALEKSSKINTVLLDKTGTITEGKPEIIFDFWENKDKYLPFLLSIEHNSNHPLSKAIVSYFGEKNILKVKNFKEILGKGVEAEVEGKKYFVGSLAWIKELKINISEKFLEFINNYNQKSSIIIFANETEILAMICISDKIKENSKKAISDLKNIGIEVFMLTGDSSKMAESIAEKVGISNVKSELKPTDKQNIVKNLQKDGKIVAMVGDGINDSQALAEADISIAMGTGSDIAMDVAGVTIISSDLQKIKELIQLSKQTTKTVKQNLFWAFIYNIIGIPIAAGVLFPFFGFLLNPMIASAAMAFSSISVVLNSLILKYKK
ncbi:copper-translocating P-type ATPase [Candidatus Gracilibacteria bacterium]|nr:MAG: copper-translocating P-type ATPase [Candidatus Gracilibacteria bacterium]